MLKKNILRGGVLFGLLLLPLIFDWLLLPSSQYFDLLQEPQKTKPQETIIVQAPQASKLQEIAIYQELQEATPPIPQELQAPEAQKIQESQKSPASLPMQIIRKEKTPSLYDPFVFPEALAPQVAFWHEIFTKYTTDHLVIHDNWYLPVIYDVIDISQPKFRSKAMGRKIAVATKRKYEIMLAHLAKKWENLDAMTTTERKIYDLFQGYPESSRFKKIDAQKRVRIQVGQADRIKEGLIQVGVYLDAMRQIFAERGLPETFVYLPIIESSFNIDAESYLGAAGMWQFMRGTSKDYGLVVNGYLDERKDPIKATKAAAELLWHNYQSIQSWPLAITAYNHGLQGMKNAVNAIGSAEIATIIEHYTGDRFKFASRNFYPEFLAAINIGLRHTEYFGKIELSTPRRLVQFTLPEYVSAQTLATYTPMILDEIKKFNPALSSVLFNPDGFLPKHYALNLPQEHATAFTTAYAAIPQNLKLSVISIQHQIKKGETISTIAQKYQISTTTLAHRNNITNLAKIKIGKILDIPINIAIANTTSEQKKLSAKTRIVARNPHARKQHSKKGRVLTKIIRHRGKAIYAKHQLVRRGKKS